MRPVGKTGVLYVLCDIAEVLDLWLKTPIPLVLHEERMLVEEPVVTSIIANHDKTQETYPE